jgi:hypothetical protein
MSFQRKRTSAGDSYAADLESATWVKAFQSKVDKLQPLGSGYEVQDEDGKFYLGGVNGGEGPQEGV